MDRNVEMFMQIQRSLLQNRVIVQPAIYLRPEIDKISTVKLKDIVKRHLGIVVEKPSESTHVVYPQPNAREEGGTAHSSVCLTLLNYILLSAVYDNAGVKVLVPCQ